MNFQDITTSNQFSMGTIAKFLAKHPLTPPHLRKAAVALAANYPDDPEANLQYSYASATLRSHLDKAIAARNAHPRLDVDLSSKVSDLTVTAQSITTTNVEYSNRFGFPVRSGDENVALRAYAADALSASFTSPSKTSCEFAPNFVVPVSGLPLLTAPTAVATPWTGDALKNAEDTFSKLTNKPDTMRTMAIVAQAMQTDAKTKAFTRAVPISTPVPQSIMVDGKPAYPTLLAGEPKYITSQMTLIGAYTYMAMNRAARGTDKDHISSLTSGYYWMSCTRAINSAFCDTLLLFDALTRLELSAVFFDSRPDMALMCSLVANKVVVFHRTDQRAYRETLEFTQTKDGFTIIPGIYPINDEAVIEKLDYLRVYILRTSPPTISKKDGVKYADIKEINYINEVLIKSTRPAVSQVYAAPGHFDQQGLYVYPSVRAHSGHIMLSNTAIPGIGVMTQETCASRITNANLCKTWFPFSRSNFCKFDKSRYNIVFAPLHTSQGFKIRMTERVRKVTNLIFTFEGDGEHVRDPPEDECLRMSNEAMIRYTEKYGSEMLAPREIAPLHVPTQNMRHLPVPPALITHITNMSASAVQDSLTYMSSSTTTTTDHPPVVDTIHDLDSMLSALTFDDK